MEAAQRWCPGVRLDDVSPPNHGTSVGRGEILLAAYPYLNSRYIFVPKLAHFGTHLVGV